MFTSWLIPFHGLEYAGSGGPLVKTHVYGMDIPRPDVDSVSQIFLCLISPYIYEIKIFLEFWEW